MTKKQKNRKIEKKTVKLIKKELRVRAVDARTRKTSISHLSTQINLIQYFGSIFHFNFKIKHILQTKHNS